MYSLLIFFFNDTATTEIYTLSLHDALPIWLARSKSISATASPLRKITLSRFRSLWQARLPSNSAGGTQVHCHAAASDRESTPLNSSHANTSYAAFCL